MQEYVVVVLRQRAVLEGGTLRRLVTAVTGLALAVALVAASRTTVEAGGKGHAHSYGKTYPEWVAAFWKYALELPLEGHPVPTRLHSTSVRGKKGRVWFWSAPDGPAHSSAPSPCRRGKALFLTLRDVECSSLETPDFGFGAHTTAAQRDCAFLCIYIL